MAENSSSGISGRIVLVIITIVPLLLMIGVAVIGLRTENAGEAWSCTADLANGGVMTLTVQPKTVSSVYYEDQIFTYQPVPEGESTVVMQMGVSQPTMTMRCDENIGSAAQVLWVWNEKGMTVSADEGESWHLWEICDEPRPEFGCTPPEHIQAVSFVASGEGSVDVFAPEGSYQVMTEDGGATWQMTMP
ncbi:hypothetical protein G4Y79_18255 [Phototrophicus methaneseepsis]|uniref:Uncharacterized protein n=1 Tax=Phototrophicus methaneseepsis TaxID=2710758 RepID=A0A7S8E771_9CHLR|nr:hypothetical protein [Phototrophicus methaneseepsis]QPC81617.1 hypothetical protein G4Y79_18255 [Phototrophicus methaneseepsis]